MPQCGEMASLKTCPHAEADRLLISGTELRDMLAEGRRPTGGFSRPEVIDILIDYYRRDGGSEGMKNVVLFTIDTLRRDALGCTAAPGHTPFLDSLAADSVVFTHAHSVAPYTQASFPGILTSSYSSTAPRRRSSRRGRTMVSEPLREKGVTTAGFHSNPYLCAFFGWNRGWDTFYDSMEDDVDDYSPYIRGGAINARSTRG